MRSLAPIAPSGLPVVDQAVSLARPWLPPHVEIGMTPMGIDLVAQADGSRCVTRIGLDGPVLRRRVAAGQGDRVVDELRSTISHAAYDAERGLHRALRSHLLGWREAGDPQWERFATSARLKVLRDYGVTWYAALEVLGLKTDKATLLTWWLTSRSAPAMVEEANSMLSEDAAWR